MIGYLLPLDLCPANLLLQCIICRPSSVEMHIIFSFEALGVTSYKNLHLRNQ